MYNAHLFDQIFCIESWGAQEKRVRVSLWVSGKTLNLSNQKKRCALSVSECFFVSDYGKSDDSTRKLSLLFDPPLSGQTRPEESVARQG